MAEVLSTLASCLPQGAIAPWDSLDRLDRDIAPPGLRHRLTRALDLATVDSAAPPLAGAVFPASVAELADVVALAAGQGWGLIPWGSGSKLGWGKPARGAHLAVGLGRLAGAIDHDASDLVVTVPAGARLAQVQAALAPSGQWLPIDPAFPDQATIGGLIATADAGPLRQRYGGLRDLLLGIQVVRADGAIAKAGGRVVKNVAGYDLMKLMTGSFGTLGILTEATFRAYPIPEAIATLELTGDLADLERAARQLSASALTPIAVDFLGLPPNHLSLAVRFGSVAAAVAEQLARLRELGQALGLTVRELSPAEEAGFWTRAWAAVCEPDSPGSDASGGDLTLKLATLPTASAALIARFQSDFPAGRLQIHAGSGLGRARLPLGANEVPGAIAKLLALRQFCQAQRGFLTLLDRPLGWPEGAINPWGYAGNARGLMETVARQFDPDRRLNPGRFVV